jgi:hypothetical protein
MPEDAGKTFITTLTLSGSVDKKLIADIKGLLGDTATLVKTSKQAGVESKKQFQMMAEGVEAAKQSMAGLVGAVGDLIAPIGLAVAGFSSFKNIVGTLDAAAEKVKSLREQTAGFEGILSESDWGRAHGINKLMEYYKDQALKIQKDMGGIVGTGMVQSIQSQLAALSGRGPSDRNTKMIEELSEAWMVKHHTFNMGAEDAAGLANQTAMFLQSGNLARGSDLRQILRLSNDQIKNLKNMKLEQREQLILNAENVKFAKTGLDVLKAKLPEEYKLRQAQIETGAETYKIGEVWLPVMEQTAELAEKTKGIFLNILDDGVARMAPIIKNVLNFADDVVGDVAKWIAEIKSGNLENLLVNMFPTDARASVKSAFDDIAGQIRDAINEVHGFWDSLTDYSNKYDWKAELIAQWDDIGHSIGMVAKAMDLLGKGDFTGAAGVIGDEFNRQQEAAAQRQAKDDMNTAKAYTPWGYDKPMGYQPDIDDLQIQGGAARGDKNPLFESSRHAAEVAREATQQHAQSLQNAKPAVDAHAQSLKGSVPTVEALTGANNNLGASTNAAAAAVQTFTMSLGAIGGGAGGAGGAGGGFGLQSGHSGSGGGVFEQYPWEGHAANYGPHDNKLGDGYGVGLGVNKQAITGAHFGDKVRIDFADGTSLVRTVNETSEQPNGVEFFSNSQGEYNTHGAATVTKLARGGIVTSAVRAILGERGPEAVIPLSSNRAGAMLNGNGVMMAPTFNVNISGHSEDVVAQIREHLQGEFTNYLNDAAREFERAQIG